MQVTSLLSQHDHSHDHAPGCDCGHDHSHANVRVWQLALGLVFVLNAYVVDWLFTGGSTVASISAFIGALILGTPIILIAVKDLREGKLSINELVAIAVLAAFAKGAVGSFDPNEGASAGYKIAGVVAFFMLLGEIIETRITKSEN